MKTFKEFMDQRSLSQDVKDKEAEEELLKNPNLLAGAMKPKPGQDPSQSKQAMQKAIQLKKTNPTSSLDAAIKAVKTAEKL